MPVVAEVVETTTVTQVVTRMVDKAAVVVDKVVDKEQQAQQIQAVAVEVLVLTITNNLLQVAPVY